jgi:phage-related protein
LLLRLLQRGERLGMPASRPMPDIGPRCHELRITDEHTTWRIMYALEEDAVVILDVFAKTTRKTPRHVLDRCKARLARYHAAANPRTR